MVEPSTKSSAAGSRPILARRNASASGARLRRGQARRAAASSIWCSYAHHFAARRDRRPGTLPSAAGRNQRRDQRHRRTRLPISAVGLAPGPVRAPGRSWRSSSKLKRATPRGSPPPACPCAARNFAGQRARLPPAHPEIDGGFRKGAVEVPRRRTRPSPASSTQTDGQEPEIGRRVSRSRMGASCHFSIINSMTMGVVATMPCSSVGGMWANDPGFGIHGLLAQREFAPRRGRI